MAKSVNSWKDCTDSKAVLRAANKAGADVRHTKGSHFVMQKGEHTMTGYDGEISTGVATRIFKFLLKIGGVGVIFLIVYTQLFS